VDSISLPVESQPSMFHAGGPAAARIAQLGWLFTIVAVAVTVISVGVLIAALHRRRPAGVHNVAPFDDSRGPVRWIVTGGVILPAIILAVCFVCTVLTQSAIARPPRAAVATIRVTAHRWWWAVQYPGLEGTGDVVTANEIHIPAGQAVQIELASDDVIHSFWVPELAGKTDVIPGQINSMWLQADHPGRYAGECAEYCGVQHAHMGFVVVADAPADFAAWAARQRQPAAAPLEQPASAGLAVFRRSSCAACHAIRGTGITAPAGPDLTHVASRATLASAMLPNNRGNLAGWVTNAQSLKPGSQMPTIPLDGHDLQALVAYLEALR
jgi:cytochrome c oxidase subunit II